MFQPDSPDAIPESSLRQLQSCKRGAFPEGTAGLHSAGPDYELQLAGCPRLLLISEAQLLRSRGREIPSVQRRRVPPCAAAQRPGSPRCSRQERPASLFSKHLLPARPRPERRSGASPRGLPSLRASPPPPYLLSRPHLRSSLGAAQGAGEGRRRGGFAARPAVTSLPPQPAPERSGRPGETLGRKQRFNRARAPSPRLIKQSFQWRLPFQSYTETLPLYCLKNPPPQTRLVFRLGVGIVTHCST